MYRYADGNSKPYNEYMLASIARAFRNYGLQYCLHSAYRRISRLPITGLQDYLNCGVNKRGLEIGGPSKVFERHGLIPLYDHVGSLDNCNFASETLWHGELRPGRNFLYSKCKPPGEQFVADTGDLAKLFDQSYEFLLSCHVIEHTANPLRALRSWRDCLRHGGRLLLLVPEKTWTFDHRRPVTTLEHLVHDLEACTGEDDLTHLQEILQLHDLARDPDAGDFPAFKARSERNFENRCLHHHVFDAGLVRQVLEYSGFIVESLRTHLPNHIIAIAQKI